MNIADYAPCLNMLYTDDLYLFKLVPVKDPVYGSVSSGWQKVIGENKGNVQNYSGDLAYQEYGMKIECQKKVYAPPSTVVEVGWGIAFSDVDKPELIVKYAPTNKTHRIILAGTR